MNKIVRLLSTSFIIAFSLGVYGQYIEIDKNIKHGKEIFPNCNFKIKNTISPEQKKLLAKRNVTLIGNTFPANWTLGGKDGGKGEFITKGRTAIKVISQGDDSRIQLNNYKIPISSLEEKDIVLAVTSAGTGSFSVKFYCYNAKGIFLRTIVAKSNTPVVNKIKTYKNVFEIKNFKKDVKYFSVMLEINGNLTFYTIGGYQKGESVIKTTSKFNSLAIDKKIDLILNSKDYSLPLACLNNPDNDVRNRACYKLQTLGEKSFPAINQLSKLLIEDSYEPIRVNAALALCAIGKKAYPTINQLLLTAPKRAALTLATAVRGMSKELPSELKNAVEWANPPVAQVNISSLPDGDFEGSEGQNLVGWKVVFVDGATGHYEIDPTVSRNGTQSLKITKTNGKGYILLSSTSFVKIPGTNDLSTGAKASGVITYRFFYRATNAFYNTLLTPRLIDEAGNFRNDDHSINRGRGIVSQVRLRNTPNHVWTRRLLMYKPRKDTKAFRPAIVMYGNPGTVWIDDVQFPAQPYKVHEAGPTSPASTYSKKQADEIISQRPAVVASVQKESNNKVSLKLNGKVIAPVLHMNRSMFSADYDLMNRVGGINLHVVNLNFSGNTRYYPFFKPWNGTLDDVDKFVDGLGESIRKAPHANFILGLGISFPTDFVAKYPDEAWLNEKGEKGYGNNIHMRGFATEMPKGYDLWWPSQYSEKQRELSGKLVRAILGKIKKQPYSKLIAGVFIHGGHDGQFQIHRPDYSKPAYKAWRSFLKERYKNDEALRIAWNNKNLTIKNAPMPSFIPNDATSRTVLDPEKHRMFIDHREFREAQIWKNSEYFARIFKEIFGQDKLALTWCMGGGWQKNFNTLLSSCYDAFIPQPSYTYRLGGYTGGLNMPANTYLRNGKLVIAELDTRNWMRCIYNEVTDMWIGVPRSKHDFRNQVMKDAGRQIAQGHGYWYFDIGSNEYRHPEAQKVIKKLKDVSDHVAAQAKNSKFVPQAALIFHQQSVFHDVKYSYYSGSFASTLVDEMLYGLKQSGVPTSSYFLEDLMKSNDWKKHKVFVFLNANVLTDSERNFINNNLKKNGNTLIWIYTSGISNGVKFNPNAASNLIGMKLNYSPIPRNYQVNKVNSTDPLSKGLPLNLGCGDVYRRYFDLRNSNVKSSFWVPCFDIVDKDAIVLGKFNDGKNALAVKRFDSWTSVLCAAPGGLDAELFYNIAKATGIYVLSEPGLYGEVNDFFISLHGCKSKKYTISLPRKVKVVRNAWSNEVIARDCDKITLDIAAWQSMWLTLE